MNRTTKNLTQRLTQTQPKIKRNAHERGEFCCSATPAPTPPVSLCEYWNTGVGAGIYNNKISVGVGVRIEEEEEKTKGERKHRGKPPELSLSGQAGFSTPFPEGMSPLGSFIFLTLLEEASND